MRTTTLVPAHRAEDSWEPGRMHAFLKMPGRQTKAEDQMPLLDAVMLCTPGNIDGMLLPLRKGGLKLTNLP